MEKNRIRSVKTGKSMRMSYQRQKEVLDMPNLIEVQKDSYKWFLDEGLKGTALSVWNSSDLHSSAFAFLRKIYPEEKRKRILSGDGISLRNLQRVFHLHVSGCHRTLSSFQDFDGG